MIYNLQNEKQVMKLYEKVELAISFSIFALNNSK